MKNIPGLIMQSICPSCFEEISLGDCDIVNRDGSKILKKAPKVWSPGRLFVPPLDGPFFASQGAHRRCSQCGYLLPYNIEQVRNITLAVVGDTTSGKSTYLTSLVHQIRYEWANHLSSPVQLDCLTPEIEDEFMLNYHDRLYRNKLAVRETAPAIVGSITRPQVFVNRPLIYRLQVNHSPTRPNPSTTFNLMIYDASGEDFVRLHKLVDVARFTLNSSALIFVADPISMEPVFNDLPGHIQAMIPPDKWPDQRKPASEALRSIVNTLKRYQGLPHEERLHDVPVAIMVSKADIFTQAINYPYNYGGFLHPAPYGAGVDLDDVQSMDQEVRALLYHYQQGSILGLARLLKRAKFFATSATGTPEDTPNHFPSVKPWRCLDPMMWILYELDILRPL